MISTMLRLPYHHDWAFACHTFAGVRVHWFGRYAGVPDWRVERSRLAADMISFFFVERSGCWAMVNGQEWRLGRGDLLVTMGGDEFEFWHDPARPHSSLSVALALEQRGVANVLLCREFKRRYAWPRPDEYVSEFERVLAAMAGDSPFRDLLIAGAVLQWLAYVMDELRPPIDRAFVGERSVVDKVLIAEAWATSHLRDVITLADWARAVGLNPVYFGRIFKRETGLRPMEWLNQCRLRMARQQLVTTSKPLAEVAEACGFASPFYFSRVFKRHFGQSPQEHRKGAR